MEAPPSLETMKACGEITLGSQVELGGENFLLSVVAQAGLPAVEADFTDNTWASVEMLLEFGQPTRRALVDEPRVQTEAGQHTVVATGQVGDCGPVALAGAVDDHFGQANSGAIGDQFVLLIAESGILQMVVRIEQPHRDWRLFIEAKLEELRFA